MNWITGMKFQMKGKQYTISGVWMGQGKKVSYEFTDGNLTYTMQANEFHEKVSIKNLI